MESLRSAMGNVLINRQSAVQYKCFQESDMPTIAHADITQARTARLEVRISADLHATLKRVAEIQGRTMSDFVIASMQEAAQRALVEAEVVRLSLDDQQRFAEAILSPPKPTAALRCAMSRHDKLLRSE
jgi:uncharacterized protein (DUF1778 family)